MKSFYIQLASINDVKEFVNSAGKQSCEIDIISGRYTVDAKSIMGIFSIDLAKPIKIEVHGTEEEFEAFRNDVKQYIVD